MLPDVFALPAFWGFAGAFAYAAPQFSSCIFASTVGGGSWVRRMFDFVVSLVIGTIAAAAGAELIQEVFHIPGSQWMRAISTIMGLLANPVAPKIVKWAPDALLDRASRFLKRDVRE